jgi:DNA repair protein RadA/Sms
MAKNKTAYVCTECGQDYPRWQGQCSACQEWNTITEVRLGAATAARSGSFSGYAGAGSSEVKTLDQIDLNEVPRIASGFAEFDRVLGGGIVAGSAILIGGHPGAGKSTLLLQTLCQLAETLPA